MIDRLKYFYADFENKIFIVINILNQLKKSIEGMLSKYQEILYPDIFCFASAVAVR